MLHKGVKRHLGIRSCLSASNRSRSAALSLLSCLALSSATHAGDLRDIVKDLYGGDGITLSQSSNVVHEAHFTTLSLQGLGDLGSAIASNVGFLSFNSSITGFELDLETGIPVRSQDSLGPLIAESAHTIGQGKFNVGFTYTRISYSRFQGTKLNDLSLTLTHPDVFGPPLPGADQGVVGPPDGVLSDVVIFPGGVRTVEALERDVVQIDINLEIDQDIYAFYGTYGLTSKWDVGIIVPVVTTRARATAFAEVVLPDPRDPDSLPSPHSFEGSLDSQDSQTGGSETGIGDVLLRTKYGLLHDHSDLPDVALGGQVVLPTGDSKNLLGGGETRIMALLAFSKSIGRITPHLNLGYEYVPGDNELSNARFIGGVEVGIHQQVTVEGAILGRWEPRGDDIGDHIIDAALGFRFNVWENLYLNFTFLLPLNRDEGLRADVIWTIGGEITF